jgi:hypothetical protein
LTAADAIKTVGFAVALLGVMSTLTISSAAGATSGWRYMIEF